MLLGRRIGLIRREQIGVALLGTPWWRIEGQTARYSTRPPRAFPRSLCVMANIASQIKRNNRSLRERQENRQYTSQIKTYFRRLSESVAAGDDAKADEAHRRLVKLIDKAVKRGALHRNNGARKKSRAARLRRGA
jgi:small subunit ribosomal protein S20